MVCGMPMHLAFQPPLEPMLAKPAPAIPTGENWLYEPKWDGFRAIVFRDGDETFIQSRDLKPLDRYFPELSEPLRANLPQRCVVDGEIVIRGEGGLQFEALLQRIHPAASRVRMLAETTPASFVAWDLLAVGDEDLRETPQGERRARLEAAMVGATAPVHLTPATRDAATAEDWFHRFEGAGLDGVIAKPLDGRYLPGKRAMIKIKHARTADCVVAGFRWHKNGPGTMVGSLLLGLYDDAGKLNHVGVTASFTESPTPRAGRRAGAAARARAGRTPVGRVGRVGGCGRGRGAAPPWRHVALERGQGPVLGAAPRGTCLRGRLRPPPGRPLPTRHDLRPLATGPHARVLPIRPAGGHRALRAGAHLRGRLMAAPPGRRPRGLSPPSSEATLEARALGRATLARQHLLSRVSMPAEAMIDRLVGMQAQVPENPYVALWSRLDGFEPSELSSLLETRRAVRGGLMRGTLHLATERDFLAIWPLIRPVLERVLHSQSPFGRRMAGIDPDDLTAAGRAWLEQRARTRAQLVPLMAERWPDHDAPSLAYALTYLLPLVQVTPRGLWRRSGPSAFTTVEAWLGRPIDPVPDLDALVIRYLAAFGPASVADIRTWSGLAGLREVVARLRPQLLVVYDERGRELFDLPDAPRPDPATQAPVRFLPEYDNVLLAHDDRSRFGAGERVTALFGERPIGLGSLLVDGLIHGTWRVERVGPKRRPEAMLHVRVVQPLGRADRAAVVDEGERLLAFLAPDAASHGVRIAAPE